MLAESVCNFHDRSNCIERFRFAAIFTMICQGAVVAEQPRSGESVGHVIRRVITACEQSLRKWAVADKANIVFETLWRNLDLDWAPQEVVRELVGHYIG